jgi:formylglycine-generating enzyme required for sulfatase activity
MKRLLVCLLLVGVVGCGDGESKPPTTPGIEKSDKKTKSPTKKWALLIGVNDYVHGGDLKYAVDDQVIFSRRLVEIGFSEQHIYSLLSGATNAKDQPFKSNIEIRLQTIMGLADEGDLVLVAFSGHGVHLDDETYICPADADIESPKTTMIKVADIYTELDKSKATFKLIVVDACRNNSLAAERRSLFDKKESLEGIAKTFAAPPPGILVLSSSAFGQYSVESTKLKQGVFMAFLQHGLTGVADSKQGNRDGQVSVLELYKYASEETKLFVAKEYGSLQTPSLHGNIAGDFMLGVQRTVTNSIGMKLKLIPAGEFRMGSGKSTQQLVRMFGLEGEEERWIEGDFSQHVVRINQPFYLGEHVVTQSQYEMVMGARPWKGKKEVKEGADYPVVYVSHDDAVEFCRRLSEKEGVEYRLPTEAEWEYACRAGTTTIYSFGDGEAKPGQYAWYKKNAVDIGEEYAHRVGRKLPNPWGLYDMHGNVYEWCQDWYASYGSEKVVSDPVGPAQGFGRVLRSGSWANPSQGLRSATRGNADGLYRDSLVGFRVARTYSAAP